MLEPYETMKKELEGMEVDTLPDSFGRKVSFEEANPEDLVIFRVCDWRAFWQKWLR